jgi:hypothetical protein
MENGGIFGSKMSGKTTLAKRITLEYWNKYKMASLVLDINGEQWGQHALMFTDEKQFWDSVWSAKRPYLVVVDESTETIARDKGLIPVFTRLRHLHHKLLVIGHHGMNLLPIMREQLDTLYLFRQSQKAAQIWAENFTQDEIQSKATHLNQYEFIHTTLYGSPKVYKLKI